MANSSLILVNHSTTSASAADAPLNSIGLTESHMASEKVANWEVTDFYASPLRKCLSTAKILAKPFSLEVIADERLDSLDGKMRSFLDDVRNMDNKRVLAVTSLPVIRNVLISLGIPQEKIDSKIVSPLAYSVIEFAGSVANVDRFLVHMFSESSKLL